MTNTDNEIGTLVHQGKPLSQWAEDFKGEFTLNQLEKMARGGADLQKILVFGLDESFKELPLDSDEGLDETDSDVEAAALSESIRPNYVVHVKVIGIHTAFTVHAKDEDDAEQQVRAQIKKLSNGSNPKVEIEKIQPMNQVNESFDSDIITVNDFIRALKRNMVRDNDKIMFRLMKDKAALSVFEIYSKGGTAVIDLVPALANESANWEDTLNEEKEEGEEDQTMNEGRNWRTGGYGGYGRSYSSYGEVGAPRGKAISWFTVDALDPKARGKMDDWRVGPSNFPFKDLLYPERKYKTGTTVLRSKHLDAGSESGVKYIAIPSYLDAVKNNDEAAIELLKTLGVPLDLTFGYEPNEDFSATYTISRN